LTKYYKKYCKVLSCVSKLAKRRYNDNIINSSDIKIKTTWNIVKNISNIKPGAYNINQIKVNGELSTDGQTTTKEFSKYFASVVQNKHLDNAIPNRENPIPYLFRVFIQLFPPIKLKCVSSKEIEDIIMALKIKN
jgi:hypothetical protein